MNGTARPRLLRLPSGPLLLSGGPSTTTADTVRHARQAMTGPARSFFIERSFFGGCHQLVDELGGHAIHSRGGWQNNPSLISSSINLAWRSKKYSCEDPNKRSEYTSEDSQAHYWEHPLFCHFGAPLCRSQIIFKLR